MRWRKCESKGDASWEVGPLGAMSMRRTSRSRGSREAEDLEK